MATTPIAKSLPVPRKRAHGLTVMMRAIVNARTPLGAACFYSILVVLLLAALAPVMSSAGFVAILSSSFLSSMLGGQITHFSGFTTLLAVEVYSSFYALLFGGFLAWIGGAALPIAIEDGTLDLALSRPISRTRYYLENWLGVLIGGADLGFGTGPARSGGTCTPC